MLRNWIKVRAYIYLPILRLTWKPAWTEAHAFFTIMGGYHAYGKNGPIHPLSPDDVARLVYHGKLVPLTGDDLSNQSNGDVLSKGVAVLQAVWFVAQCIARLVEHLPLTNLEVMTLAYTVMTVAMYIAWWDKPLNVSCAIRVPGAPGEGRPPPSDIWKTIYFYVVGVQDEDVELEYLHCVPTFWAGKADERDIVKADIIALSVAMAFGAVHCIAWSYTFPSHSKLLMWRVSAMAIIIIPAVFLMNLAFMLSDRSGNVGWYIIVCFSFIGAPVYICARAILLVLSFTTLTSLPYELYQTVQWTEFIPHL